MKSAIVILFFSASTVGLHAQNNEMVINGDFPPEYELTHVSTEYFDGAKSEVPIVEGKFELRIPCADYPYKTQLILARSRGEVKKAIIVEPGTYTLGVNDKGRIQLYGGYYNDKVYNDWIESKEMDEANEEFEAFRVPNFIIYRNPETPMLQKVELKQEYERRKSELMDLKNMILMRNMQSEDPYLRALSIEEMKVNEENMPYIDPLVKEIGHIPYVRKLAEERIRVADYNKRLSATSEGRKYTDFKCVDTQGRKTRLSSALKPGKCSVLFFYGGSTDYEKNAPELTELIKKYGQDDLMVVCIEFNKTPEQLASPGPFTFLHDAQGKDSPALTDYAIRMLPQIIVVDAKGVIRARVPHVLLTDRVIAEIINK